jgi:LPXTG-site transpeptidase (sortase) family protein
MMPRTMLPLSACAICLASLLATSACAAGPDPAAPLPTRPPAATADPWAAHGLPARITIPAIRVDAAIEALDLTGDQKIGVPQSFGNVGWYRHGYRPGEPGRAILSGHLDDRQGRPAVFARLKDLQPGDEIRVRYADGTVLTFAAGEQRLVDVNAVDESTWQAIFGASERAELSLITCDGVWDPVARTYSRRLVVFAAAP